MRRMSRLSPRGTCEVMAHLPQFVGLADQSSFRLRRTGRAGRGRVSVCAHILLFGWCIAAAGPCVPATCHGGEIDTVPQDGLFSRLAREARVRPATASAPARFTGAGSCAAAACHGGTFDNASQDLPFSRPARGARVTSGSEYSIWIQSDRHAMAYTTLFSRRSQLIARNLGLQEGAPKAAVCLACHSLAATPAETVAGRPSVLADGVSCEACHGAAELWLEPHKRRDWKDRSAADNSRIGFVDTKSVLSRTTACLRCHVGDSGRDVDHDLIAAGHPRLYFEMSAYHAKMPRHWDQAADHQRQPALEAKMWVVGQLATAEAALGVLEHRASSKPDAPWPEFAEYACFACHHDLAAHSWRQQEKSTSPPGRLRWGTWNFALAEGLVRTRNGAADADALRPQLDHLADLMSESAPPQAAVADQAHELRSKFHDLAQAADRADYGAIERQRLIEFVLREAAGKPSHDWESATQLYLALVAIAQADREGAAIGNAALDPAVFVELKGLRDLLRFPAADGRLRFTSPGDFDAQRIGELSNTWQRLRKLIEKP